MGKQGRDFPEAPGLTDPTTKYPRLTYKRPPYKSSSNSGRVWHAGWNRHRITARKAMSDRNGCWDARCSSPAAIPGDLRDEVFCTKQVEDAVKMLGGLDEAALATPKPGSAAAARDSRSFIYFRMGKFVEALKDFDAALAQAPSHVMRGVTKHRHGDTADGKADIEAAEKLNAGVAATDAKWGVKP
jgi:hypothetical protein